MSSDSVSLLSQIKFWFLIIFSIPCALCSILILTHLYQKRNNLSIHHHLTLLLTTISFIQVTTQIPLGIAYYRGEEVIPATSAFCTWWIWWTFSLNGTSRFIMVWGSIERHFLIFNISLMATKTKRWIFHILPTLITSTYPIVFYFIAIVLNTCQKSWNYRANLCGTPCYMTGDSNVYIYDMIGTILLPILMISIANILLLFRVVYKKRRRHGAWRRQRKLTIQLLGMALIYILFWFPAAWNGLFIVFKPSYVGQELQVNYFMFLANLIPIFLPFILLATLPELMKKFFRRQRRTVRPT